MTLPPRSFGLAGAHHVESKCAAIPENMLEARFSLREGALTGANERTPAIEQDQGGTLSWRDLRNGLGCRRRRYLRVMQEPHGRSAWVSTRTISRMSG